MDNRIKHLEFIQSIITRMNSNSFMIKGWTVTLVSALFALSSIDANRNFILVAYLPVIIFWGLDGYYLSQERKYRALFNKVRIPNRTIADFSLDVSEVANRENSWTSSTLSKTLIGLYIPIIALLIVLMFMIR